MPNSNVIEIILEAIDNASAVISGVSKTVEDSAKKSTEALKPMADASAVVEQAFGKLKGVAAQLGVALGVAGIFKEFISEAGESEMASVRLELAYKNLGIRTGQTMKSLNDFAMATQRSSMYTDEAVSAMQERLFRFGTLTGDTFVRVQKATVDYAAAMQMDLAGAAQMLGRALEDPSRGMLILRRSGLILSDNQKQLIKDFVKAGETAKAQAVILDELEKRYNGTAEAVAGTLTGSLQQLRMSWEDLFEGTSKGVESFKTVAQEMAKALQDENIRAGFDAIFGLLAEMTRLVAGVTYGWVALGGAIAGAFKSPENGGELRALWDQQSAAVADYTTALDNLARTRKALNLAPGQKPTATQLDQKVEVSTAVGGQMTTTLRERLQVTTQLLVKTQQLQKAVNEASLRDPAEQARAAAAAGEKAAQAAADTAKKAADDLATAERKKAEARKAAIAAAKEEAKLVEQINQDTNSTLAAIEAYTGVNQTQGPIIDLQLPDVADPSKLIDMQGIQDAVSEAQKMLDTLTAPTLEEIQLQIQTDAGWIDPVTDGIREAVMAAEDLVKTPIEKIQDKFADLETAIRTVILTLPEGSAEIERLNDLLVKLAKKQAEEIKGAGDEITEFSKQAARNAQDAFANFLFDPFKGGIRGLLKAFSDAVRQMVAQIVAAQIFKKLGFAALFAAAGGGIIPRDRPTVVGEDGPEILIPTAKGAGAPAPMVVGAAGRQTVIPAVQSEVINKRQIPYVDEETKKYVLNSPARGYFISVLQSLRSGGIGGSPGKAPAAMGGSAGGGVIPAGKPRIVGEEGPEIIVPTAQSVVINKRQIPFLSKIDKQSIGSSILSSVTKQSNQSMERSRVVDLAKRNLSLNSIETESSRTRSSTDVSATSRLISSLVSSRNKDALVLSDTKKLSLSSVKTSAKNILNRAISSVKTMSMSATTATIGGSAGGGIVPAGKPRLVGEEGPEIILPTVQARSIKTTDISRSDIATRRAVESQLNDVTNVSRETRSRMRRDSELESSVRRRVIERVAKVAETSITRAKTTDVTNKASVTDIRSAAIKTSKSQDSAVARSSREAIQSISTAVSLAASSVNSAKSSSKVVEIANYTKGKDSGKGSSGTSGSSGKGSSGGGSAGGGMIPANQPRLVGENGPEVIIPTAQSNVINARQMAFAGNRSANVNYSPSSTIVINGSADKEAQKQMAAMIQYNNQQQMKQITAMLYNNGLGRMR